MEIPVWIQLVQLILVGAVSILGVWNFMLNRKIATLDNRIKEKDAYTNLVDGILELKQWAVQQEILMKAVREVEIVDELIRDNVIADEEELMTKCILFFYVEKLYHLSCKSGITHEEREGLDREIEMWLRLKGMKEFFNKFCKVAKCHDKEFLEKVGDVYNKPTLTSK